jgi:hypothetical protein
MKGGAWESMSPRVYRNIDEIFAGDCEGLTPEEVRPDCLLIVYQCGVGQGLTVCS